MCLCHIDLVYDDRRIHKGGGYRARTPQEFVRRSVGVCVYAKDPVTHCLKTAEKSCPLSVVHYGSQCPIHSGYQHLVSKTQDHTGQRLSSFCSLTFPSPILPPVHSSCFSAFSLLYFSLVRGILKFGAFFCTGVLNYEAGPKRWSNCDLLDLSHAAAATDHSSPSRFAMLPRLSTSIIRILLSTFQFPFRDLSSRCFVLFLCDHL